MSRKNTKKDWEIKTLEEVCDFYNGLWTGKKPPYRKVGVIRNTNFTKDGLLNDSDIAQLEVEVRQYEKRKLEYGDIILEKSGGGPKQPVGRVVVFDKKDGEFSFSNFTSAIRVKDKNKLNFSYLHKALHRLYVTGETEKIQKNTTGIRNLDFSAYKQFAVPLPPLVEQKRIVKILDEKFAAIGELKRVTGQQIVDAKELFESRLNEIFLVEHNSWSKVNFEDHIKFIDYRGRTPKKTKGGIRLITAKNIKKVICKSNRRSISQKMITKVG